jgi:hypothetical protein
MFTNINENKSKVGSQKNDEFIENSVAKISEKSSEE